MYLGFVKYNEQVLRMNIISKGKKNTTMPITIALQRKNTMMPKH
jgi:hypothetical protein